MVWQQSSLPRDPVRNIPACVLRGRVSDLSSTIDLEMALYPVPAPHGHGLEAVLPVQGLRRSHACPCFGGRPTNLGLIAELETACNLAPAPLSHGLGVALPTQGLGRMHTYLYIWRQACKSSVSPVDPEAAL